MSIPCKTHVIKLPLNNVPRAQVPRLLATCNIFVAPFGCGTHQSVVMLILQRVSCTRRSQACSASTRSELWRSSPWIATWSFRTRSRRCIESHIDAPRSRLPSAGSGPSPGSSRPSSDSAGIDVVSDGLTEDKHDLKSSAVGSRLSSVCCTTQQFQKQFSFTVKQIVMSAALFFLMSPDSKSLISFPPPVFVDIQRDSPRSDFRIVFRYIPEGFQIECSFDYLSTDWNTFTHVSVAT